ncbi:P-loop containing nucleoside triphosphate hydrolase protein [Mycena sanguinolenta]|nr:P-loop containing nucleoside triphosphate hydrolase protein [Mycena sanguinolenta]
MHKYAQNYRETHEYKEQLSPHIFQLANNAYYYHMRRTTQDHGETTEDLIPRLIPPVTPQSYFDNGEWIRLLPNKPSGLVHIMDDQTAGVDTGAATFTMSHFNSPVTYSVEGFLAKNLDALNPDFISLLHGESETGQGGSVNPIVKGLFLSVPSSLFFWIRYDPNAGTAHAPSQRKPTRGTKPPSSPRSSPPNPCARPPRGGKTPPSAPSPLAPTPTQRAVPARARSRASCAARSTRCSARVARFLRLCINPNEAQLPNQLERRRVKRQVRSVGLSAVAQKAGAGIFEVGMPFGEFAERYAEPACGARHGTERGERGGGRGGRSGTQRIRFGGAGRRCRCVAGVPPPKDVPLPRGQAARDVEETKRNCEREGVSLSGVPGRDPYAPYPGSPMLDAGEASPCVRTGMAAAMTSTIPGMAGTTSAARSAGTTRISTTRGVGTPAHEKGRRGVEFRSELHAPLRNMFDAKTGGAGGGKGGGAAAGEGRARRRTRNGG